MLILRIITIVFLSLTLAIAGLSNSGGKPVNGGLTNLTLCTETGPEIITIDGQGEPVDAEHFCLDCCLSAAVTLEQPGSLATGCRFAGMAVTWGSSSQPYITHGKKPHTRGPPPII